MKRPKRSDYPVMYYDNGLKIAINHKHLPAYVDEWASSKPFLERSVIYRTARKERAKFKKYTQAINDIIFCSDDPLKKIDKIRKVLYVLNEDK